MNDTTIIGLGVIGAALAQTLLKNGYKVTVWNRSPEKAEALKKEGAIVAMSSAEAIAANPTVVFCIKTHTDTRAILESAQSLEGKNIIELSTGSAPEAQSLYQWINEKKAECLIGMICTFWSPYSGIGEKDSTILTFGSENLWNNSKDMLEVLAGKSNYIGDKIGSLAHLRKLYNFTSPNGVIGVHGRYLVFQSGFV